MVSGNSSGTGGLEENPEAKWGGSQVHRGRKASAIWSPQHLTLSPGSRSEHPASACTPTLPTVPYRPCWAPPTVALSQPTLQASEVCIDPSPGPGRRRGRLPDQECPSAICLQTTRQFSPLG